MPNKTSKKLKLEKLRRIYCDKAKGMGREYQVKQEKTTKLYCTLSPETIIKESSLLHDSSHKFQIYENCTMAHEEKDSATENINTTQHIKYLIARYRGRYHKT